MSQQALILEYYKAHPKQSVPHKDVVDWSVTEYKKRTGEVLRDPDRAIRKLHQDGVLIKVDKGLYKYDSSLVMERRLSDFTEAQKKDILKRGGYRCAVCGARTADGVELQVDHIRPKDKGGKAVTSNGQVLCAIHNYRKKNYSQTESGKRMFVFLYSLADKLNDRTIKDFCKDVLNTYKKHDINGHIDWDEPSQHKSHS